MELEGGASHLIGRGDERALLLDRLGRTTAGTGGRLAIVGPAGAGKTAILDWFAAEATAAGARVLRAAGADSEQDLAWATLAALLGDDVDRGDRLPGRQRRALRAALALDDDSHGDQPVDRLAVSLGVLGLWSDAARTTPLVVVVDDLHWVDAASRHALAFVGRRLADDPVLIVTASRTADPDDRHTHRLDPLDDGTIDRLLADAGLASRRVRGEVAALADGNPLLAGQLARALTPPQRAGTDPLPAGHDIVLDVDDTFAATLARLPETTRQALAVLAVDPRGAVGPAAAALAACGRSLSDVEPAETLGLVTVAGGQVRFTHPVARRAAARAVGAGDRRRAHRVWADVVGVDTERGVRHRLAAALGPDPALAVRADELARDALHRGAPIVAASWSVAAAAVADDDAGRSDRLVRAAQAALAAGEMRWAGDLLDRARRLDPARVDGFDARRVEIRLAVAAGDHDQARRLAEAADDALAVDHPLEVARLLGEAARPLLTQAPFLAAPLTERQWTLVGEARDRGDDVGPAGRYAEVLYGCGRFVQGDAAGAERHLAGWPELLAADGPVTAGAFLAETVVLQLGKSGRADEALRLLDHLETAVRATGAPGALVSILAARCVLEYGRDLTAVGAAGREALDLSVETGQPGLIAVARSTLAIAAASAGDEELTRRVCDDLLRQDDEPATIWARASLGRLHLVHGRDLEAADQFDRLRAVIGATNPSFTKFEADEAEALVRVGRLAEARDRLPGLAADAAVYGPWAVAMHERVLALLADDLDQAVAHFERAAAALARTDNRLAHGLVELHWGERLRRGKRKAEARLHLQAAVDGLGRIGAVGLRRRAEDELHAAGGVGDRSRPTRQLLTPVELHVAQGAVAGASNREIAAQLFLSPRTVENHLGAVYRKLGVAGRPGLVNRAGGDADLRVRSDAAS